MDDVVTSAFTEAAAMALRELAGVEAVLVTATPHAGAAPNVQESAMIRLQAPARGTMIVAASAETARALAARILAESAAAPDAALVRDCFGEVANVIAGQAKTLLHGTPFHFTLSTPTAARGEIANGTQLRFATELGDIELFVELTPTA